MADLEAVASRWLEAEIELAISRIEGVERELAQAKKEVAISEQALTKATAVFDALTLLAVRFDSSSTPQDSGRSNQTSKEE